MQFLAVATRNLQQFLGLQQEKYVEQFLAFFKKLAVRPYKKLKQEIVDVRISCRNDPKKLLKITRFYKKLQKKGLIPNNFTCQQEIKGGWFWRERDSFPGNK
jgi:hypothetical protein